MSENAYLIFTEKDTCILNFVDQHFKRIALSLDAKEYYVPTMIHREVLEKCGYFDSYPQHLTAAAHIGKEHYTKVMESRTVCSNQVLLEDQFLVPAVCIPLYPTFEGKTMDNTAITFYGRAYRYEDGAFNGSTRLWEYGIREIVFIGSPDYVNTSLKKLADETIRFIDQIGLPAKLEIANDHFYPSAKNKLREKLQTANQTKEELNVRINGKTVSLSSYNYHGTHFSKIFHFDNHNQTVSGCVGYGLERWVAAINEYGIRLVEFEKSDRETVTV